MKINKIINNPTLYYKLDPGEPGLATPSLASQSIARVSSHEMGNIIRFKKEANEKGGIVVYSFIGLNLKFMGSFLAATAGKSEALIVYPAKKEKKDAIILNNDNNSDSRNKEIIQTKPGENSGTDGQLNGTGKNTENIKDKGFKENADNEIASIDKRIRELENEKNALASEGTIKNLNPANDDSLRKESSIDKIERKIRMLEMKKDQERKKNILEKVAKANYDRLMIFGLNFGTPSNDKGNIIDTIA